VVNSYAPSKDVRGPYPRRRDRAPAPFARKVGGLARSGCRRDYDRWCGGRQGIDALHHDLGSRVPPALGGLPSSTTGSLGSIATPKHSQFSPGPKQSVNGAEDELPVAFPDDDLEVLEEWFSPKDRERKGVFPVWDEYGTSDHRRRFAVVSRL